MKKKLLLLLLTLCCAFTYAQNRDLEAKFTHYTPNQTINVDSLRLEFKLKNNGPGAINAGDTLFISLKINTEYLGGGMGPDSPPYYAHVMANGLAEGESVDLDPGYLLLDPMFLDFYGTPTLDMCLIVWGIGLESVDAVTPSWPMDTNPSNNSACIVYDPSYSKPTDLAVSFTNYDNSETTNDATLELNFNLQNLGPENLMAGDTVYLSARINGTYMGLNLTGTSTPYTLTEDLLVGQSISINPGYLSSELVLNFFPGTTTFEACIVAWGKNAYAVDTQTPFFPQDLNATNNTYCVTYSTTAAVDEVSKSAAVTLYPNPAKDKINFSFSNPDEYLITVFDAAGRVVMNIQDNGLEISMDITRLGSGMYIYNVAGANGSKNTGKFIVE